MFWNISRTDGRVYSSLFKYMLWDRQTGGQTPNGCFMLVDLDTASVMKRTYLIDQPAALRMTDMEYSRTWKWQTWKLKLTHIARIVSSVTVHGFSVLNEKKTMPTNSTSKQRGLGWAEEELRKNLRKFRKCGPRFSRSSRGSDTSALNVN